MLSLSPVACSNSRFKMREGLGDRRSTKSAFLNLSACYGLETIAYILPLSEPLVNREPASSVCAGASACPTWQSVYSANHGTLWWTVEMLNVLLIHVQIPHVHFCAWIYKSQQPALRIHLPSPVFVSRVVSLFPHHLLCVCARVLQPEPATSSARLHPHDVLLADGFV